MTTTTREELTSRIGSTLQDWAAITDQDAREINELRRRVNLWKEDSLYWYKQVSIIRTERDQARAEIQRARDATVQALGEQTRAAEQVKAAEAKVVDIGGRKNALIKAVEAKGFVVRWAKDGTPEVLTKEEAEKRDQQAASREAFTKYLTESYRGYLDDYRINFARLLEPRRKSTVIWDMGPGAVKPQPTDTLVKQEPVAAPEPKPTVYERAMKLAGFESIKRCIDDFADCTAPVCIDRRAKLDEALLAEIQIDYPTAFVCQDDGGCDRPQCKAWHARPWK